MSNKAKGEAEFSGGGGKAADVPLLKALRESGHDRESVYGDPMFADADAGDFTLDPASPAHRLGIEQLSLEGIGLTREFAHEVARVGNDRPSMWEQGDKGFL